MDNFRKFKTSRGVGSVDGVVGGRPVARPASRPRAAQAAPATAPKKVMLDEFRKSDGFRPATQPKLQTTARPAGRQPQRDPTGAIAIDLPKASAPAKKSRKQRKPWVKRLLRGLIVFTIIFVIVAGFLVGKAFLKTRNIFKGGGNSAALQGNVDPSKLNGEGDGRVNILLLGKGGEGHEAPDLTDTILVASIDPIAKEMALLSIPRDLYVNTDAGNSKINAVYANAKYDVLAGARTNDIDQKAEAAGLDAIESVVSEKMGIPIHYNVMVDFEAFKQAIDAVGGITINVTEETAVYEQLYDTTIGKPYTLDVKPGQQNFDGQRALFFSRSRKTSPRGDFDRAERQRLVIIALKEKILSVGTFSNPSKINGLLSALGDNVSTNLKISEMLRLYEIGKDIQPDKIASLSFVDPPNVLLKTDNIGGQSVVVPIAGLTDYTAIQSFVRNSLKDAFLKQESANVAVFNGTNTPGLAAKKAEILKSFGYNVTIVGNTTNKNYTNNVIVDMTNGQKKFTKSYLEKRFGVTAVSAVPETLNTTGADFVIIIGSNDTSTE